jgi:hypothetical protein
MQFYNDVRSKLGHRTDGFDFIFNYLKDVKDPLIVETGCARQLDNYEGDGQSSLLFDKYIKEYGGEFHTVDISLESTEYCQSKMTSRNSLVYTDDSITRLKKLNQKFQAENRKIDFLYLDSFDAPRDDPDTCFRSALHHIYELLTIAPSLKPGALIGVDDNWVEVEDNKNILRGKGQIIYDYMVSANIPVAHAGYQIFWRL